MVSFRYGAQEGGTFLQRHPGNIRELENIIEHAFILCEGTRIEMNCLPKELLAVSTEEIRVPATREGAPLERAEAEAIEKAFQNHRGNRTKTAQDLGVSRTTLWRKMKRYGLADPFQ